MEERQSETFYQAKCGTLDRNKNLPQWNLHDMDQDGELEEIPEPLKHLPASLLHCTCCDPRCKLKRYFRNKSRQEEESLQASRSVNIFENLHTENPALDAARRQLESLIHQFQSFDEVYQSCLQLITNKPDLISLKSSTEYGGDTVLIQLCRRKIDDSYVSGFSPSEFQKKNTLLHAQILSFARIYVEKCPELLFTRNQEGLNALTTASLSNKKEVSIYLVLLYKALSRDPNEACRKGHTILHMLARKGDQCSETLEGLLELRDPITNQRLLKMDIVNQGRKTPLDVALACQDIFSTGQNRLIYKETIELFHKAILNDAKEIEEKLPNGMTFRNF